MEQEKILNQPIPTKKVYQEKQLWLASYLGGPLVAGYLIAQNFKVFGEKAKARNTWIVTISGTILLFAALIFAPYVDRVPNFLFPLVYTAIATVFFQMYQSANVAAHIKAGGLINSWWRTVGVAIVGFISTLIIIVAIALTVEFAAGNNVTAKNYGTAKSEIAFDKSVKNESINRYDRDAQLQIEADALLTLFDDMPSVAVYTTDEPILKSGTNTERGVAYTHCDNNKFPSIFVKKIFYQKTNRKQIVNVLKHELTHAWLCRQERMWGHDAKFHEKFKQIGGFGN